MRGKLHIVFKIVVLLYAVAVGVLCFAKFDPEFIQEQSQLLHLTDKDVHFLMFLPFVPLIYLAFASSKWGMRKTLMFSARMVVVAVAVASMIELIQGQTGYRGEDLWDAVAGIAGAAVGMIGVLAVKFLMLRHKRKHGDGENKSLMIFCILMAFSLSVCMSPELSAQSRDEFSRCCDTLTVHLKKRTGVSGDKLSIRKVLKRGKKLDFYFDQSLGDYPWHEEDVEWFRKEMKSCFPKKYSNWSIGEVFSKRSPLKEFVTPKLTYGGFPTKSLNRVVDPAAREKDIVRRASSIKFSKGLEHRNIALWQSHGYYYEQSLDRWEWQRACLFQTVEDMFTQSFVLPFLVPMLENAGAYVMLPRERDLNTDEYIIDNDIAETSRGSGDFRAEGDWKMNGPGFADTREIISDNSNPFFAGTFICAECGRKSRSGVAPKAVWRPHIKEKGEYAVYVAYRSLPESTESARYTIMHSGGTTEFLVNQRIGGGTWIYLGTFPFDKGKDGCVILDGSAAGSKEVICADAVRFGGGMGNIARGKSVIKRPQKQGAETMRMEDRTEVSGMPRYAEGARYSLQWYGAPEMVWSQNEGNNDYGDDYMCRGTWVDWLSGGSRMNRKADGLGIPIDLSFAFHTDAGIAARDTTVGTLTIYTSASEGKTELPSGERRLTSREYADIVQSQIVADIRATYDPDWTRRGTKDRSYLESRTPTSPAMILELLSHQNFNDMKFGLDPSFRFLVSRSVYKGMLKYLSNRYGCPYAVQPLPVRSFATELDAVGDKEYSVTLSWLPTEDRLEPTASPKGYILSKRTDDGAFDEGIPLKSFKTSEDGRISCSVKLEKGHIYSFRVSAYNDGGKSFPSEILSVGLPKRKTSDNILIVNNFTRVAAPSYFDTSEYAGFDNRNGGGVGYVQRINYIGETYQFRKGLEWKDDDAPGFGASYTDMAASVLAGNTFDYPARHGKALMKLGYGFVSMSAEAFQRGLTEGKTASENVPKLAADYPILDLICGKQATTPRGTGKVSSQFAVFPEQLQEALREYTLAGGSLIVSGANIGTDISESIYSDLLSDDKEEELAYRKKAATFAAKVLGYKAMNSHASRSGEYRWVAPGQRNSTGSFHNSLNPDCYSVENPDGIVPSDNRGKTVIRYKDTGISAGTAFDSGTYKCICIGFPIEAVKEEKEIEHVFEYCLDYLKK